MRAVIKPLDWIGRRKTRAYITPKDWYEIQYKNRYWLVLRCGIGGYTTLQRIKTDVDLIWDENTANTLRATCERDYQVWMRRVLTKVEFVEN
jgi:hypothetical protein